MTSYQINKKLNAFKNSPLETIQEMNAIEIKEGDFLLFEHDTFLKRFGGLLVSEIKESERGILVFRIKNSDGFDSKILFNKEEVVYKLI